MIISFAYTTPALLAGVKTVTRRTWEIDYARKFKPGALVDAYDKSPRNGGKRVAVIRITELSWQFDRDMPDSDYEAEGFAYLQSIGMTQAAGYNTSRAGFDAWRMTGGGSWVVRFEVVEILRAAGPSGPSTASKEASNGTQQELFQ